MEPTVRLRPLSLCDDVDATAFLEERVELELGRSQIAPSLGRAQWRSQPSRILDGRRVGLGQFARRRHRESTFQVFEKQRLLFWMLSSLLLVCLVSANAVTVQAGLGPVLPLGLTQRLHNTRTQSTLLSSSHSSQHVFSSTSERYPARYLEVPIDHFHNDSFYAPHSDDTFRLRYFSEEFHYRPGGPLIILDGGETSVEDRLPFLASGIVKILCEATGGIGVILEHRYYGESHVTPVRTTS